MSSPRTAERTTSIDAVPIPWLTKLMADSATLQHLSAAYGSPLHLHNLEPFVANVTELQTAALTSKVDLGIFFARKANKAMCYVEAAIDAGIGIDIAGSNELAQALKAGADRRQLVVTSAIKPDALLATCLANDVLVVLDNADESNRYSSLARTSGRRARVAIRLSNFAHERARAGPSRFGFDVGDPRLAHQVAALELDLDVRGLHFHLDGYSGADRISALQETMQLYDRLAAGNLTLDFIDMGGGFPVSYAAHQEQWESFWACLDEALVGMRPPITYRNDGYGQIVSENTVLGPRHSYPHFQSPTGGAWLQAILEAVWEGDTIAEHLRARNLQLRCEPGRALLNGCGATVARVVHTKTLGDDLLVALDMNSSNCRTQKSELLTDPIHVTDTGRRRAPCDGYLTGAYCSESDLITKRRLRFDVQPARDDLVVFPNTAGYYMHFTESRSHQFSLPLNAVQRRGGDWTLDDIDANAPG